MFCFHKVFTDSSMVSSIVSGNACLDTKSNGSFSFLPGSYTNL